MKSCVSLQRVCVVCSVGRVSFLVGLKLGPGGQGQPIDRIAQGIKGQATELGAVKGIRPDDRVEKMGQLSALERGERGALQGFLCPVGIVNHDVIAGLLAYDAQRAAAGALCAPRARRRRAAILEPRGRNAHERSRGGQPCVASRSQRAIRRDGGRIAS